jgi:predicted DNA-binding transcriptional regulator AlpA
MKDLTVFHSCKFYLMSALQSSQEILTIVEVTELTGFSRTSIWRLRKSGQLPTYKVNYRPYFKRSDVMELIESARVEIDQEESYQAA